MAKSQNGPRVKMGFCSLPPDRVKLAVNSKRKQTAGSKLAKSQDFCYLPPERVKLTVNSKKETNSMVKMSQRSRWASVIYPLKESKWGKDHYVLLLFTPDRVKLIVNSKKETNSRVKMGKESKWAKGQDGLLFFTP